MGGLLGCCVGVWVDWPGGSAALWLLAPAHPRCLALRVGWLTDYLTDVLGWCVGADIRGWLVDW